jgi:hypothetical protein
MSGEEPTAPVLVGGCQAGGTAGTTVLVAFDSSVPGSEPQASHLDSGRVEWRVMAISAARGHTGPAEPLSSSVGHLLPTFGLNQKGSDLELIPTPWLCPDLGPASPSGTAPAPASHSSPQSHVPRQRGMAQAQPLNGQPALWPLTNNGDSRNTVPPGLNQTL